MSVIRRAATLVLLPLLSLLAACSSAPPASAPPVEAPVESHELTAQDVNAWLDGQLTDALKNGGVPGAVVSVVKDGQVLTTRGYGWAQTGVGGGDPVAVDAESTLFRVGSISKIPTSIAVMQLVEQGKLDLDADISAYLDFEIDRGFEGPVTLRHLLTHTAGFEDKGKAVIEAGGGPSDLEAAVKKDRPAQVFAPGTTPAYSNYGMALAGYIVQRASGQPFEDYVREHVLEPAGMGSSTYAQPLPAELEGRMASGYTTADQPAQPFESVNAPAGALTASAPDFAAFMIAQLERSPELLSEAGWEQMWSPNPDPEGLGDLAKGDRMGLGYWIYERNGHRIVEHGGDTAFFHSDFEIYPEDGVGIFIAMNGGGTENASGTIRTDLMEGFTDRYFPAEQDADQAGAAGQQADPEQSRERAAQVAGSYQVARGSFTTSLAIFAPLQTVSVSARDNGNLVISAQGQTLEYEEIEPWVWQRVGGYDRIAADTTGTTSHEVRLSFMGPHTLLPVSASTRLLLPVIIGGAVLLVIVLVAWPIGALRRRRKSRSGRPAPAALPWTGRIARIGGLIALVVTPGWLAMWVMAFSTSQLPSDLLLRVMQAAQWAGALAIVPAAWDLWTALRGRAGWRRITVSGLLVLGLVALAWVAWSANLLTSGTRY
ncbi:serine hydrolase domain-containing protein [Actinomyces bowdenii]|uniref:Beta-lactamase family protein n=1 Tax=Actinomyces bowdenii TaxID=131109 RepID=A0A853EJ35_9ACTO|nr:serine hydrolase domain-containing protein [Actinomyces bowdenii]MBF0696981.1 beta-lactamase family protein [Actinomyces bowdenii]NYS69154.1 beta-lactamase family protein [Actinomyces bowdenii]